MILHGGLIALRQGGLWRGVLIEGPSGAGKSDLALRALTLGFRLVADDRVEVFASQGRLFGQPPAALSGLIEARGVGILAEPPLALAEIVLAARCAAPGRPIERMPAPGERAIAGVAVPSLEIRACEASAPAKLRHAVEHLGAHRQQAYQARFAPPGGRAGVVRAEAEGTCG